MLSVFKKNIKKNLKKKMCMTTASAVALNIYFKKEENNKNCRN